MTIHQPLTCRELVELVTEYLEETLDPHDRQRFEEHLRGCDGCQAYLQQMRLTIQLCGNLTEDALAPQARQTLLDLFQTWKQGSP